MESILGLLSGQALIIDNLKRLFHHRWNIPVLSTFHEADGGLRFVELVMRLGVSRDSLRSTLLCLAEMGLVQKNPGYGHPLRPEYLATALGTSMAAECHRYLQVTRADDLLLRKWSAPLLLSLRQGNDRFNDLRKVLTITPRALTQVLRQLGTQGLVIRTVEDGYPPATSYHLSKTGAEISRQVDRMYQNL